MAHQLDAKRIGWPNSETDRNLLLYALVSSAMDILRTYAANLQRRSRYVAQFFQCRMGTVAVAWLAVFACACIPRLTAPATPVHGLSQIVELVLPYVMIALAPIAGFSIAAGSFPRGLLSAQPSLRLSFYGRWNSVGVLQARKHPAFGPAGFMASLLVGMLLNVVFRSFEFLLAMPALGASAPQWSERLFMLMAADVIMLSFFYMVCFVMALRTVPFFPRMLMFAWALDIMMQLLIGREIAGTQGLPDMVAAPLHGLLQGNITKVMISAVVWLPYLILSDRVNITYRLRASSKV